MGLSEYLNFNGAKGKFKDKWECLFVACNYLLTYKPQFKSQNQNLQPVVFFLILRGTNETDLWIIIEKIERIVKGSGDW